MVEKVGNLLMFPAFHNVEQSDQKSGFQKDMYSLFLQIDTIPEQQKLFTILLMNYYSKKKQNRNLKVTKKVRSANLAQ